MSLANVNGVAVVPEPGRGQAIVVYVTRKVPLTELEEGQAVPGQLEGVPVHVVELGSVTAQTDGPGGPVSPPGTAMPGDPGRPP